MRARLPGVPDEIAERVCAAVARLRGEELYKLPGVGETIAWAQALLALDDADLEETLGVALKVREDIERGARAAGCSHGCREPAASARAARPGGWRCSPPRCAPAARAWASASCSARTGRWRRSTRRPRAPPTSRCARRCARAATTSRPSTPRSRSCFAPPAPRPPPSRPEALDDVATLVLPRVAVPGRGGAAARRARTPRSCPSAWSDVELLREKDFADYTDAERRRRAGAIMRRLAGAGPDAAQPAHAPGPPPRRRPARRAPGPAPHDARLAAHAAATRSSATGASPASGPRPLVLVCDVSGLDGALRAHAARSTCRPAWPRAAAWRRSCSAPA